MHFSSIAFAALAALLLAAPARAVSVALPSTGSDSSGNALAGGSLDPHYSVIGPGIPSGGSAVVYSNVNLWSQWVANDAHSKWIGWSDNSNTSPHGNYTFELKVDLSGYNAATASITGSWAADQFGSIDLNGNSTGQSVADGNWNSANFPNLTKFTISSGFTSGINTLDFVVDETDGFDGLLVRNVTLTADATGAPLPKPVGGVLFLLAAISVYGLRRRFLPR